jgi:hypothetical protein
MILEEMRKYWAAAVWSHSLFSFLRLDNFAKLRQGSSRRISRCNSGEPPESHGATTGDEEQILIESGTTESGTSQNLSLEYAFGDPMVGGFGDFEGDNIFLDTFNSWPNMDDNAFQFSNFM